MASSSTLSGNGKNERIEAVVGQVYAAVRRSLCPKHFQEFESLYKNLNGFARYVVEAETGFREQALAFFPPSPHLIDLDAWKNFEAWLLTENGQRVMGFCLNWGFYGRYAFRVCLDCVNLVNPAQHQGMINKY